MTDNHPVAQILSAVPYLAELDAATLASIGREAVRQKHDAGAMVFLEGEPCAGLCIVEQGWLKAVKISLAGREQVLRVVGPGEVCNEISVFAGTPNPATVMALEAAVVWTIRRDAILGLMDDSPSLARTITRNLAGRVLNLLTLVEDLSLRTVEERLARLLLQRADEGTLHRRRWATQTEMAARIGTVPDVLNRALRDLVKEGLIRVERHQIQILDPQGLEAKATPAE
jgi:CRP/FNR family transcriptional regulator